MNISGAEYISMYSYLEGMGILNVLYTYAQINLQRGYSAV